MVVMTSRRLVEAQHISFVWIMLHVLFLVLVIISGISGGVVLSLLCQEALCGSPSLSFASKPPTDKPSVAFNNSYIVMENIVSGKRLDACQFTQYTLVCSFIFGTIWLGFFLMCRRGESTSSADYLPQPWRIVLPALVFSTIMALICLGASIQNTMANNVFCSEFDMGYAEIRGEPRLPKKCQDLDLLFPERDNAHHAMDIESLLTFGEALAWLSAISWACSAALCIIRMLFGPDFQVTLVPGEEVGAPIYRPGSGYQSIKNSSSGSTTPIAGTPEPQVVVSQADVHAAPDAPQNENTAPKQVGDNGQRKDVAIQTKNKPRIAVSNKADRLTTMPS